MNPMGLYSGMSPPGRVGFIAGNLKFRGPGAVLKLPFTEIFPCVMAPPHTNTKEWRLKEIIDAGPVP